CGISNGRAKQLRKKHFRLIPYAIRKKHFPRKLNPRSKNTIFYTLALFPGTIQNYIKKSMYCKNTNFLYCSPAPLLQQKKQLVEIVSPYFARHKYNFFNSPLPN
ncbi:MAG: hypothetical protein MUO63_16555, partial [Desulfobulbaceae bacterium]|nr:hypothetical protein [Desulfobulbaceae bacterium]